MALDISSRSPRDLGRSRWTVTNTVLPIVTPTPAFTQGQSPAFQTFLLVRASYIIRRSPWKIKMQSPLLTKCVVTTAELGKGFPKPFPVCLPQALPSLSSLFLSNFSASPPLYFISFSRFLLVKSKTHFLRAYFSQGTALQSPEQFCLGCLVSSRCAMA